MSAVWTALARALSAVEDRPCCVPGLESACYTTRSGAEYVVLHNPRTRTYVRVEPREFELLSLMDGRHSVKELVIAYYRRHGVLALARVAGLVSLLARQGLLTQPPTDAYATLGEALRGDGRPRPGRANQLSVTNVDNVLGEAYQSWGRLFFTRAWLWVGVSLGVLGPLLVLWETARGRYVLSEIGGSALLTIIILVALALVALAIHELGHGLAVKHAGRRVHEAGLRLYFGLPAAYVDTSDIWMAPPRQRLITAFAGPWTGLVLGGLSAVAAAFLPTGALGALLFMAAFVFLVDNLFNFNPLLELDGYYLLIDFLDRPLLRPQALAFVRGPLWVRLGSGRALTREEQLLASFGLGAVLYGVLAVVLAARAWQALLGPFVLANWQSGEVARQLIALAMLLVVGVALGLVVLRVGQPLAARATTGLTWLGGRAEERRHRAVLAALRAVPLWAELPPARLLELARAMRAEHIPAGHEVVRQGEPGHSFYLIASGAFEVLVDGRPQVRLGPGDYFGERALLGRGVRAATVVAMESSRVYSLEQAAFNALLASDLAVRARLETALAYRAEVAQMPLFEQMSAADLDLLLTRLVAIPIEAGEVVIRQGELGERFYIVRSGKVEVERDGDVLATLGPGDAFGEIALLLDVPRTATVRALEPTELLALDAHEFRDLLAGYLGQASELERLSHLRLRTHKRLDEVM